MQPEFMQKNDHCKPLTILIPILDKKYELQACLSNVAGLPLSRRVALMADKAGFGNLVIVTDVRQERLKKALAGTGAQLTTTTHELQINHEPVLLLAPDCLPDRSFFVRLGEIQIGSDEMLLWDDGQAILLGGHGSASLSHHLAHAHCFGQLLSALGEAEQPLQPRKSFHALAGTSIRDAEDCRRAETMLLSGLVKATEGWMALHINRKISLAVTSRLMHTAVTPNHMTWVSMILGLIGAACFLSPAQSMQIWGALFFLAHSILDGCDGELARLKFMESRLGGILDFWSDNVVHVSVFAAMGVGWAAASHDSVWPLLCAGLAVGGTAASASLVYMHTMHAEKKSGPLYTSVSTSKQKSAVVRIADILSRRDFIYLVLLLALLGQTHWFLIMTAIGAPIYALLLIGIMIRE